MSNLKIYICTKVMKHRGRFKVRILTDVKRSFYNFLYIICTNLHFKYCIYDNLKSNTNN